MPVYLCQPGSGAPEPWRHGIQVYASPFSMDETSPVGGGRDSVVLPPTTSTPEGGGDQWSDAQQQQQQQQQQQHHLGEQQHPPSTVHRSSQQQPSRMTQSGMPIRRVRHAEVVLVDDVCIAFDRYWLRLRWPGGRGGFAGYIALGKVGKGGPWGKSSKEIELDGDQEQHERESSERQDPDGSYVVQEERGVIDGLDTDDPARDEEPQDNADYASTRSSEPFESTSTLTCLRTGLDFPSSVAMKLMAIYDDGLSPSVTSAPLPSEPVFCRICREGLHDDADDQQPSSAMENEADDNNNTSRQPSRSPSTSSDNLGTGRDRDLQEEDLDIDPSEMREPAESEPQTILVKGPITPHPSYQSNPHAAENPILAPCECAGSMAFVHYLCVEQWRCQSRHPEAHHGLSCETCGSAYALPPPSARPANVLQVENEDWLEAMPPHVMAALRQPHIWWQIGAAIVRRRWLRPIAPVLMSPLVALYCRARRLLKKKGVARRRWACSLCRRRARWKCVRCLRSYYCSRQCQNVSWHIVHKHVCYKPSRWGWSVVVYGVATLFLFPGILRDPLMYDLGLGFVPASFYIMGILGGGIATVLKKSFGVDLRGRPFEMLIILLTLWLVVVAWGLVRAFFGDTSNCQGAFGSNNISLENDPTYLLHTLQRLILRPAKSWFLMWDKLALNSGPWLRRALCTSQPDGCFEHLPNANSDFFFEEFEGGKCASDLSLVSYLFMSAGVVALGNNVWKRRERLRRAARRPVRDEPRPHQD